MFNVTKSPSLDERNPYKYDTVQYSAQLHCERPGALTQRVIYSHGVQCTPIETYVAYPRIQHIVDSFCRGASHDDETAGEATAYQFTCRAKAGAMLLLNDHADGHSFHTNKVFPRYMKKHHSDWMRQAQVRGLDVSKLDIILVRGTLETTPNWTVVAFQDGDRKDSPPITGSILLARGAGLALPHSVKAEAGVDARVGPMLHNSRDASSTDSVASSETIPCNHCVFLSHYKVKYRIFPLLPRQIKAAAGPSDLKGSKEDAMDPAAPIASIGETEYEDERDIATVRMALQCVL